MGILLREVCFADRQTRRGTAARFAELYGITCFQERRILAALSGLASGKIGQEMQNRLLAALQDQVASVRRSAAIALRQVGQGSEAVLTALLAMLQDEEGLVRDAAWEALWTLTSDRASGSATPSL